MAYTERTELKEEILPNQTIQLRTTTIVERDGVEVGRSYHREVFTPGAALTTAPTEVQLIAAALWSPEVVESFAASQPDAEV